MDPIEFVQARLAEVEQVAREASRCDRGNRPATSTGEHWHWMETDQDRAIAIDPVTDEYVGDSLDDGYVPVALRSVEEYPTDSVGDLPHFIIPHAEEVPAICGMHIAYWHPARVLALTSALQKALDEYHGEAREYEVLRSIAEALYGDHPDFPEEWRS